MPGIWYQMGLHCTCGYEVTGFTFSGVPGVVIGHNARVAWGFTNLGPDVTDLYLERVDGDRVQVGGVWRSLQQSEEIIRVAGGDPVTITVRSSGHGPLLSDASEELRRISGDAIVNATGWDAAAGFQVDAVPSMRLIVDMSRLDSSRWIQLTGNSGHAFHPNYHDQFELWRTGGTLPMRWDREGIERAATGTLRLRP